MESKKRETKKNAGILKNMLAVATKPAKTIGSLAGAAYGKAKYGLNYNIGSGKVIDTAVRNKMKEENRGRLGQVASQEEFAKRSREAKKKFLKK